MHTRTDKDGQAIPKSVPARLLKHIEFWDDERFYGNGILVTAVGLAHTDENTDNAGHIFSGDNVRDVINDLKNGSPCNCKVCVSHQ